MFLGIETPVEVCLRASQKYQNTRTDLLESVRLIQSFGLEVMGGFIVGFDNDLPNVFEEQVRFIRESAIPVAVVGLLTALPGTQLYRRLLREGRLLLESSGNNTHGALNFIPRMTSETLLEGYKDILKAIYAPESTIGACCVSWRSAAGARRGRSVSSPTTWRRKNRCCGRACLHTPAWPIGASCLTPCGASATA